jgi:hypothetical protein
MIGKAAVKKKTKNWWVSLISTTATDIEEPRTSDIPEDIEEVTDSLEVKEQKRNS